jgi:hypothetical protein
MKKNAGFTLQLSAQAHAKLEKLCLRSLDGHGRMPDMSQVVERLIDNALKHEPEMPYPRKD